MQAPIYSTVALYTIYLCIEHDYGTINHMINGYYLLFGAYIMHTYQFEFLDNSFGNLEFMAKERPMLMSLSVSHLISICFSSWIIFDYINNNNWMINNYIAI